jgi:hypothetical protein
LFSSPPRPPQLLRAASSRPPSPPAAYHAGSGVLGLAAAWIPPTTLAGGRHEHGGHEPMTPRSKTNFTPVPHTGLLQIKWKDDDEKVLSFRSTGSLLIIPIFINFSMDLDGSDFFPDLFCFLSGLEQPCKILHFRYDSIYFFPKG